MAATDIKLKDTLNSAWKNDKSGFGFKMLQKMGWSEDKGLGKHETGITSNIKISKREEGLGLGMDKTTDGAGAKGWNQTASSFNDVLSILKESYGSKSIEKKKLKAKKVDSIKVGVKYHKHSHAKDLSAKTDEEKRAVLGAAATAYPTICAIPASDNEESDDEEERAAKKARKREKKEKKRKRSSDDSD